MDKVVRCYLPGGKTEDIPKLLSYEELTDRIGGFLEVHSINGVYVVVDEEGKLKGLPLCCTLGPYHFRGPVFIGKLTDLGLEPMEKKYLDAVDGWVRRE